MTLTADITSFSALVAKIHTLVNGDTAATVSTDNGTVKSHAKAIADFEGSGSAAVTAYGTRSTPIRYGTTAARLADASAQDVGQIAYDAETVQVYILVDDGGKTWSALGDLTGVADLVRPVRWGSVAFPPENGEDNDLVASGGITIGATNDLFKNPDNSANAFLETSGALAIICEIPLEEYGVLRRWPMLCGSHPAPATTTARVIQMAYRASRGLTGEADRDRIYCRLKQEGAEPEVVVRSAAIGTSYSGAGVVVLRHDGSEFTLDLFDALDGNKLAGTALSTPAGWAGIYNLTDDLGIGIPDPSAWPQDLGSAPPGQGEQQFGMARGRFAGLLMIDGDTSDAEWAEIAQGAAPADVFDGAGQTVRLWMPGATGGALDLSVETNGVKRGSAPATQLGTLLPGRDLRASIYADRVPSPACVSVLAPALTHGLLPLSGRSTASAGTRLEVRIASRDGTRIIRDWHDGGTLGPTWSTMVALPGAAEAMAVHGRIAGAADWVTLADEVWCGYGIWMDGQSQVHYGLSQTLVNDRGTAPGGVGLAWGDGRGRGCFFITRGRESGNDGVGILRGQALPALLGGGAVAFFGALRTYTDWPIFLCATHISGTTNKDKLTDDGAPDDRDMADAYEILAVLAGVDAAGLKAVSLFIQVPHSSDAVDPYGPLVIGPNLTGVPSTYIPTVDDWPLSGAVISPTMLVMVPPRNRTVDVAAGAEATHDAGASHVRRQSVRDLAAVLGFSIGPEIDVHHVDGHVTGDPTQPGVFTHPDPDHADGANLFAAVLARGAAGTLGVGPWRRSMRVTSATYTDGTRAAIDVVFDAALGQRLATYGGGAAVTGFEVEDDRTGFSAAITSPRTVRLTKTAGAWTTGDTLSLKIGGPGNYGQFDVDGWLAGQLVDGLGCFVQATDGALVIDEAS